MSVNDIRLVVFDIDGVLTGGEVQPLDLKLMNELAAMNQAARQEPGLPAITLCTGRPAPYVEVMLQAIDGRLPGIFENGAGLYTPEGYQFLPHPAMQGQTDLQAVRSRLDASLVQTGIAYFQPGKEYSLTLFPHDSAKLAELQAGAHRALGPLADTVDLVYSTACINVLPRGIDKGQGIQFLAQHTGIQPGQMLGVGDSDVDLPFLEVVGYSAAPSNANQAVKSLVQYLSPYPTSAGVRDILAHYALRMPDRQ